MRLRYRKESPIERLEREANDDFGLLKDIGPEYFSNYHLLYLRELIRERLDRFDRLKKILMLLGGSGAGWFMGGVASLLLEWQLMAALSYAFAILSMVGFGVGNLWLKWKYDSRGELMHTLLDVEEELSKRAIAKGRGATSH